MTWQANMDIQPVFNEYKPVTYMCLYFSKSEGQCCTSIRQAAKKAFENNESLYNTMKTIVRAYTSKRECSVQEAVYHILLELQLCRVFPAVYFGDTNMPEDQSRILLSEEEIEKLPGNSSDIFKINNIDWYKDQPNLSFCGGKYSVLDSFCFAGFVAHYTLYKSDEINSVECEYQPDLPPDILLESNHDCQYPKVIKLMNCNEKMKCHKAQHILFYHVPNKYRFPEKYAHHLLFLFYSFCSESELLGVNKTYQEHLRDEYILSVINTNRLRFEPYADLVDEAYTNLNAELSSNQDAYGQIENFETNGASYNEHVTCIENNENKVFQISHLGVSCLKCSHMVKLQQI